MWDSARSLPKNQPTKTFQSQHAKTIFNRLSYHPASDTSAVHCELFPIPMWHKECPNDPDGS
jgi:hypothetical protein